MNNETITKILEMHKALNLLDKIMDDNIQKEHPDIQMNDDIQEIQKHLHELEETSLVEIQRALSDVYSSIEQLNSRDSDRQKSIKGLEKQVHKFETLIKAIPESSSTPQGDTGSPMIGSIKLKRMEEDLVGVIDRVQRLDIRLTTMEGKVMDDDGK